MYYSIKSLLMGLLLTFALAGYAVQNYSQVPATVALEETGEVLTLRGVAVHKAFFQDTYLGAFYSLNPLKDAKAAREDSGPQRMSFYFLQPIPEFKKYWARALSANNSPAMLIQEQITISQFLKMIDSPLHKGDTLVLDYMPNIGTKVILKGSVKGIIKGNEFYSLILKVWMGRQPPSEKFKKDLFNLS